VIDPSPDMRALLSSNNPSSRKRPKGHKLEEGQDEYIILSDSNFCPCYTHVREVINEKKLMCKHILTVKLGMALRMYKETVLVDDIDLSPAYMSTNAHFKQYTQPKARAVKHL